MSKFKPTDAQARAIGLIDTSTCVRAGAGTGKTTVLVGRYMELLRTKRATVADIATMTYTEKAAKLMKSRIRDRCREEELNASKAEDVEAWRRQRVDLETASISTIHGFCSRILAEHPVEAGVDPYFTVLDAVEQIILVKRCINDVMTRQLSESDEGVLELCSRFSARGVSAMIRTMILRREDTIPAVDCIDGKTDEEVLGEWDELLMRLQLEHVEWVLAEMKSRGLTALLEQAECTDTSDRMSPVRDEALGLLAKFPGLATDREKLHLAVRLRQTVYNLQAGSRKKWLDDGLKNVKSALKALRDLLDKVPGGGFDREVGNVERESLRYTRDLIGLYRKCGDAYELEKADAGCLDFTDLLLRARGLLRESEDIRGRVQVRYSHMLVDELQDSALVERELIMLIVRDEKHFRKTGEVRIVPGKLFVVGDDKQSIYRFRGAEVSVFREFLDRMKDEGEVVDLDVSFRTVPRGVEFANDFFGSVLGRDEDRKPFESTYFDLNANRKKGGGFLEVMIPEPVDGINAAECRNREARMIADRIDRMVGSGEKLIYDSSTGVARPVEFGDIAVLFRAMSSSAIYEQALRESGIPYHIVGGGGFYSAQEVLDMLNCLRSLERPSDEVALAGTLRSPLFGISDETLYFMSHTGSIRAGLEEAEAVANITDDQRDGLVAARDILRDLSDMKNRVQISRLCEEILAQTGYDAVLISQFNGRQKLANVEKLVELARGFESSGLFTLDEFVRHIDEFVEARERESEAAAAEESGDVVRVMSIHQAKGLEFPVVFVGDLSHRGVSRTGRMLLARDIGVALKSADDGDEQPILVDIIRAADDERDEAEKLRILYVAFTRAEDHLVLSGSIKGKNPTDGTSLKLLTNQYDLVDENGTIADRLVFGRSRHEAPVFGEVPEPTERQLRRSTRAAWKVVRRLDRLTKRIEDIGKVPPFDRREYVEPVALELRFKKRFVPSEFPVYQYCPHRYWLANVRGIPSPGTTAGGESGQVDALLLGNLVHASLAAWNFEDESSLDAAIDHALLLCGVTDAVESKGLRDEVEKLIKSGTDAGFFGEIAQSKQRWSEYQVAARIGDFVVDGNIDCLYRLPDGTFEIVDYKTDWVDALAVRESAANYELQLASYAVAFARSEFQVSRVSLLFLRPGIRHSWPVDATQLAAWQQVLSSCVNDIRDGKFDERRTGECRCGYGWICGREASDGCDLEFE